MKKSHSISLAVFGVILVGVIFLFYNPTAAAILYIDQGEVFFDSGSGWEVATDEMKLKEDYKVKTSTNSLASIVLYGKNILRLEESTEINLQELSKDKISIKQEVGSTWNKVLRLTGKEVYEVETPTSVAAVRGTGFAVDVSESDTVIVGGGIVNVKLISTDTSRDITENKKALLINGEIRESALTPEELARVRLNIERDIERLKQIRQKIVDDNKLTFGIIKRTQGWNDEDIRNYLSDLDRGLYNVDELIEKSPVKFNALERLAELTKEIQKQTQVLGSR